MQYHIQIIEVGDSVGFILPDEMIAALKVKIGDELALFADSEGWVLTAEKPAPTKPDRSND